MKSENILARSGNVSTLCRPRVDQAPTTSNTHANHKFSTCEPQVFRVKITSGPGINAWPPLWNCVSHRVRPPSAACRPHSDQILPLLFKFAESLHKGGVDDMLSLRILENRSNTTHSSLSVCPKVY